MSQCQFCGNPSSLLCDGKLENGKTCDKPICKDCAQMIFLAERRTGIGSSDAASLMNVGHGCKRRLWYDKVGIEADYPWDGNKLTALGQALEPFFLAEYKSATERGVSDFGLIRHKAHPFLLAHPDGIITSDVRIPQCGVLEIKSVGRAVFYKTKREGVADDYILQVQWTMMLAGMDWGSFAIGSRDNGDLIHFDFEANRLLGETLRDEGVDFWKDVELGRSHYLELSATDRTAAINDASAFHAPDRLSPDDPRCHRCEWRDKCQGNALMAIAKADNGDIPEANDLLPLYQEYKERVALVDQAEDLLAETKEELKTRLGDRPAVSVNGRKIYYRPQKTERWDGAALAEYVETLRAALRKHLPPELMGNEEFARLYPPQVKNVSMSRPLRLF